MKAALHSLAGRLHGMLRVMGLAERRCACCLAPFDPPPPSGNAADEPWRLEAAALFCPSCRPSIARREAGYCPYCGEPSPVADAPCMPCARCLLRLPPWDEFLFFGTYDGVLRDLVLKGKFHGDLPSLEVLGRLVAAVCAEHYEAAPKPEVIVPVPLHPARLRERGYNQCREMARPVARRLGIPVVHDFLFRDEATPPQALKSREERLALRRIFRASPAVAGRRVLLLDDVCTTGSTLSRAAECLKNAGAARVDVAVPARASIRQ